MSDNLLVNKKGITDYINAEKLTKKILIRNWRRESIKRTSLLFIGIISVIIFNISIIISGLIILLGLLFSVTKKGDRLLTKIVETILGIFSKHPTHELNEAKEKLRLNEKEKNDKTDQE